MQWKIVVFNLISTLLILVFTAFESDGKTSGNVTIHALVHCQSSSITACAPAYLDTFPVNCSSQAIHHFGYTCCYLEPYEQSVWVYYETTALNSQGSEVRTNRFKPDPEVKTKTATNQDYVHSGYDKGHLAPAADMAYHPKAMEESFYFSNISPQTPSFNRGIWKSLEEKVRQWTLEMDTLHVITGPILDSVKTFIGPEQVAVPNAFYKIIIDTSHQPWITIGFIIPNQASQKPLMYYTTSLDVIEKRTGLDFFSDLTELEQNKLEQGVHLENWKW
jgi:endonuclease G